MFPPSPPQPVHVQGWGGGGWEHWWFYPTPCSASSPCQATQFITNSALTGEVYDAAAAFLSHNHHHLFAAESGLWTAGTVLTQLNLPFLLVCL